MRLLYLFSKAKFFNPITVLKMGVSFKIGTHNGTFHTDEALACYMLRKIPEYSKAEIVRSRDQKILDTCDIVVDVGAVYDPASHRYDHHQKTFTLNMRSLRPDIPSTVKLSSAGLVYHHFGEKILEAVLNEKLDGKLLAKCFEFVYFHYIQEVDGIDNGVPLYDVGEPRYTIRTDISSRIKHLNPDWNEKAKKDSNEQFEKAMDLVGKEFESCVLRFRDSFWPARTIVEKAVDQRFNTHESGKILDIQYCPWQSHLFEIEKEQNIEGEIKFAIFSDGESWRVSTVPVTPGNFVTRLPLHWCGLRDKQLQEASGIPDGIFVHSNGFIGGTGSREGALALAAKSLHHHHH